MGTISKLARQIEAILFIENNFISLKEICNKLNSDEDKIQNELRSLQTHYQIAKSALVVLEKEQSYLLTVNKELTISLAHLYKSKNQQKISKNVLETLSVIAYAQPVTKTKIDELRGVNSDNTIKLLLNQNLIRRLGRMPVPGNPIQYGTTADFLKTFGLASIKDLPKLSEEELKKFEFKDKKTFNDNE